MCMNLYHARNSHNRIYTLITNPYKCKITLLILLQNNCAVQFCQIVEKKYCTHTLLSTCAYNSTETNPAPKNKQRLILRCALIRLSLLTRQRPPHKSLLVKVEGKVNSQVQFHWTPLTGCQPNVLPVSIVGAIPTFVWHTFLRRIIKLLQWQVD